MKKMAVLFLALCLLISPVMTVRAEDGNVIYSGDAGEFIFEPGSDYSPTDLFPGFKDVMPGDSLTQTIHIKNEASKKVKVMIYMRVLGAHEDSVDFLSQLKLRVEKAEHPGAYMFHAMADQSAQMTEWVCLGLLYSGGEMDLNVILDVPVELDNAYSSQIGYLDWEFKVEEFPVESSDPQRPDVTPDTGDTAPVMGLAAGACISAAAILWIVYRKKREKDHE